MAAGPRSGFYYALTSIPLMGAGVFGPDVLHLSLEAKTIAFYGCLGLAALCVLIGATKELRAEANASISPGHRRRMIAIAGMFISGISFVTCAAIYFWPERQANLSAPPISETSMPSETSQGAVTQGDKGSLHRHYAAGDRNRLSELLFTMYNHIADNISPLQLEIHRISTATPTAQMTKRLGELRDKLNVARIRLGNLSESNGYYQDEIADVLGNWGQLSADIAAITNYIDLVSAVSPDPQDRAIKIITPAVQAMHEANVNLGTWVSECITRIKVKRDALH